VNILKKLWEKLWNSPCKVIYQLGLIFVIAFVLTACGAVSASFLSCLIIATCVAIVGVIIGYTACWLCRWRNLKKVLMGVAGFAIVFGIGLGIANYNAKQAWGSHRAKLEQLGEKFSITNFIPPTIPNDQNFAMTPLLVPVLDYSYSNRVVWHNTNELNRVQSIRSGQETKTSKWGDKSAGGNIDKGTYLNFKVVREFYRGNTNYVQPTKPGTAAEDIVVAFSKFDADLNELRIAAVTRPLARWPVHYLEDKNTSVWEILLPHLAHVKGLTVLCNERAMAFAASGRGQDALEDLKVALRLSDSLKNEPFLISYLVQVATMRIICAGIREGLHQHVWNDVQLAELQKSFGTVDFLSGFRQAMRAERAWGVIGMEQLMRQGMKADLLRALASSDGRRHDEALWKILSCSSCVFYQNMMCLSKLEQCIIDNAVDVKQHRVNTDVDLMMKKKLSGITKNPFNFIAGMLVPAVTETHMKAGRGQTVADCSRVAIAIERYQLKNGKLPTTLDELTPTFIDGIPTDVIDGKPLRYCQLSEGGYVLYSVGYNKIDDGGVGGFNEKGSPDYKTGDWVYPMPLK
jgi:hypothetical protein